MRRWWCLCRPDLIYLPQEMDAQRLKAQQATIDALKAQHEREMEAGKREVRLPHTYIHTYIMYIHTLDPIHPSIPLQHLKKSSMARSLLNEREEEVRHLSAKVRCFVYLHRAATLTLGDVGGGAQRRDFERRPEREADI